MHQPIATTAPYLIQTKCGKEYELFRGHWISIRDEVFVDHCLCLTPDGSYLYSTCNVFRDEASPERFDLISQHKAKDIFFSHLSLPDRQVFFPKASNLQAK